jgi:NhaA family Na+:H+ antiporter
VVAWAILVARIGGKVVGIWGGTAVASRLRLVDLPSGVRSVHVLGMAAAAGVGFTVSLFVAEVAFGTGSPLLSDVKIALLVASVLSGILGWTVLRLAPPAPAQPGVRSPGD